MNLRTLMILSATGMIATGAAVWTTIDPAHGSATPAVSGAKAEPLFKVPVIAPVDRSHFQAGKTLMVEGRLGHAVLPASVDSETYLFLDVSGANVVARNPAPLDLSIVIDRSGSMAGKRLTNALAAARTAIQRLRDGDVVSVVSFNTGVEVVVKPTMIDVTSRTRMLGQLASIRAGGDTCISCGIDTAMRLLGERDGMVNRILVLSDGQPTAGVRGVDGFRQIAENCRRMGAAVTTIGVDVSYDEKVMSVLARGSNGHHFFVADPAGLPAIFDQEMASLTRTVANRAELTVDLAPGVFVEQVFDRARPAMAASSSSRWGRSPPAITRRCSSACACRAVPPASVRSRRCGCATTISPSRSPAAARATSRRGCRPTARSSRRSTRSSRDASRRPRPRRRSRPRTSCSAPVAPTRPAA